ncbi:N-acetyl-1-D-myo-inositol-2-amino-2-deoxy-alpha-D-glucopyranoside deacetylase [Streptomyces sp. NPDC088726]|uniref:N-acetyl-1-D-myo-inositol-2-amino-2-deoxy-alpha- D-glucopyranoside deacetylase n=1 Tax=Streptomyces sp. NPDC088726 TaxID=3365874 RepID=UPI00382827BA
MADPTSRRALFVHAHPDDESINNGATMAKYAAEGAAVTLVTCTLGEGGPIIPPALAHLAADREDRLGQHRINELAAAMKQLRVTDHRILGAVGRYRDSGRMGSVQNGRPHCFWQADLDDAAGYLVEVIRETRPQVLVTYDANGGYGHPDHIQAHRVAMRAADLAADASYGVGAAHTIPKVYWNCVPRSLVEHDLARLRETGRSPRFGRIATLDEVPGVLDDALVTTAVDGGAFTDRKVAAMRAHVTQISVDWPWFALANGLGQPVSATEYYQLGRGLEFEGRDTDTWENDLFAGLPV